MLAEGRPYTMDESTLAATLAPLRRPIDASLPPVIWDIAARDAQSAGAAAKLEEAKQDKH